jgi:hypothetical protein
MKIILCHGVSINEINKNAKSFVSLYKSIYSNIKPCIGDMIHDSAFINVPYDGKVVQVTIDYSKDECYVSLKVLILDTPDTNKLMEYTNNAIKNGWTTEVN